MWKKVNANNLNDTIAAISTPPGEGGIGIVRLSGPDAVSIAQSLFVPSGRHRISDAARRVFYGHIAEPGGAILDEVLLHIMRGPRSYTREDIVEINCHGGAAPLQAVLERVLIAGARLAAPGEFTRRAFLNGRIDLVQAEAVIDRIRARTAAGLRAASAAAGGVLSRELNALKDTLVHALARVEAAVDFPEEDLEELVDPRLRQEIAAAHDHMRRLLDTANAGRLYREGAAIAIAGRPNVGKSSLFNALLRDARAIVSAQPGTTRDRIEEHIALGGIPVRLIDTAGLRATVDEVERLGIDIARDALRTADIIVLVVDAADMGTGEDLALAAELEQAEQPVWVAVNKTDLVSGATAPDFLEKFRGISLISAKTGQGLHEFESALAALLLGNTAAGPDQGLITRTHQRDSLRRAADAAGRMLAHYDASPEVLSVDLREALAALGEITGETTPEDVLERIFSTFCIGK